MRKKMNKYFITLCDGPYEQNRQLLNNIAASKDYETISLTPDDLKKEFTDQVATILTIKRGLGLCVWKPYIILEAFKKMQEGDIIVYLDSADMIHPNIFPYLEHKLSETNVLLVPSPNRNLQRNYTKRDCFVMMGCDNEQYWNALQIEAGFVAVKKCKQSEEIFNEWLYYCKNENIITDIDNICGLENLPNFVTHRHDQSIISNLAVKYNIYLDFNLLNYIRHNIV